MKLSVVAAMGEVTTYTYDLLAQEECRTAWVIAESLQKKPSHLCSVCKLVITLVAERSTNVCRTVQGQAHPGSSDAGDFCPLPCAPVVPVLLADGLSTALVSLFWRQSQLPQISRAWDWSFLRQGEYKQAGGGYWDACHGLFLWLREQEMYPDSS